MRRTLSVTGRYSKSKQDESTVEARVSIVNKGTRRKGSKGRHSSTICSSLQEGEGEKDEVRSNQMNEERKLESIG